MQSQTVFYSDCHPFSTLSIPYQLLPYSLINVLEFISLKTRTSASTKAQTSVTLTPYVPTLMDPMSAVA